MRRKRIAAVPAGQPPQRRDRERDAEEPERPDPGLVGEIGERIGAQVTGVDRPDQPGGRQQPGDETPPVSRSSGWPGCEVTCSMSRSP